MNKRKKIATFVCIISVVPLISLQILSPRIDNSSFWDSLAMVFCILINVIMMNRQRRIYKVSLITAVLVFLVFVYALFTSSMQVSLKYAISFLILLSPIYLSNYIIKDSIDELDVKKYKIIILVITIELIFCLIMSLAYLKIDPMAMRNMASDAGQINFFSAIGGGYKLVFCSILLVALSAYIFIFKCKLLFICSANNNSLFPCAITIPLQ